MNDIGPGDWVEAADEVGQAAAGSGVYCVTKITIPSANLTCLACGPGGPRTGIKLAGLPNTKDENSWCIAHWRPIYRPKSEIIESLKTPIKIPA